MNQIQRMFGDDTIEDFKARGGNTYNMSPEMEDRLNSHGNFEFDCYELEGQTEGDKLEMTFDDFAGRLILKIDKILKIDNGFRISAFWVGIEGMSWEDAENLIKEWK